MSGYGDDRGYDRGGYDRDERRGGGYDDRRGGYDDRDRYGGDRGGGYDRGYDDRRGGYDDRNKGWTECNQWYLNLKLFILGTEWTLI